MYLLLCNKSDADDIRKYKWMMLQRLYKKCMDVTGSLCCAWCIIVCQYHSCLHSGSTSLFVALDYIIWQLLLIHYSHELDRLLVYVGPNRSFHHIYLFGMMCHDLWIHFAFGFHFWRRCRYDGSHKLIYMCISACSFLIQISIHFLT